MIRTVFTSHRCSPFAAHTQLLLQESYYYVHLYLQVTDTEHPALLSTKDIKLYHGTFDGNLLCYVQTD
jgi:hypothetical protein